MKKRGREVFLALLLCACATPPAPLPARPGPYGEALTAWTRQVAIYDGLEARLFVDATYHAAPFRAALAAEVERLYGPADSASEVGALAWACAARPASAAREFLLSVVAADRGLDVLDGPAPAWRLTVVDATGTHDALGVERIEPDVAMRALYPYVGPFSVTYRVRFPGAEAPALKLVLAGARGRTELDWR